MPIKLGRLILFPTKQLKVLLCSALLFAIVSCGGGGGNDSPDTSIPSPPSTTTPPALSVQPAEVVTRSDKPIRFNLVTNKTDPTSLTLLITSEPENGSVAINNDGSISYTPTPGAVGADEFTINVSDQSTTESVTVQVENDLAFEGLITSNLNSMVDVEVLLTADDLLEKIIPEDSGSFKIYALADGEYAIKVRKSGFKAPPSTRFTLDNETLHEGNRLQEPVEFPLEELENHLYSFHWAEDQSTAGYEYAAHINKPLTIEFLDEQVEIIDDASAIQLQHDYNILLVDSDSGTWTQEHAYRILKTMSTIPQQVRASDEAQLLPASKWQLTSDYINGDIQITAQGENNTVLISGAAFVNTTPRIAEVEGKRGVYYSQRLHHALVRYVTDEGRDQEAYEKILNERFGVTTQIDDYSTLTAATTVEHSGRFHPFHPNEIVEIINMFEEMPSGVHKLPELQYLVRRLDGTPHPISPSANAVAWPYSGYIEFMESAFNTDSINSVHRLIIHEKSHFLWAHQFDQQLIDDWVELGGWFEDVASSSNWSTTKQTEFVSAYAHSENPNEDMAESIAYFVTNPDKLKSRSIDKYNFIRDRIMQGNIYLSQFREDLTYEVYNLYPDYVYPGKIKRVDINVVGEVEGDKWITVEIELHALDEILEGASRADMRIFSETGVYEHFTLYPRDENGDWVGETGTLLRGTFHLSPYAADGFWRTDQIVLTDLVGNQRYASVNDFGWKLYIESPLGDNTPPQYVANSASLSTSISSLGEQEVQLIHAKWLVREEFEMAYEFPCRATLNANILTSYRVGTNRSNYDIDNQLCEVEFIMPHYMPSAIYSMNYLSMEDRAGNRKGVYFTEQGPFQGTGDEVISELPQKIELITSHPDTEKPELNLNDIHIEAEAINPDTPDGETLVTITFNIRDDISGFRRGVIQLRDPQGIQHRYHVYDDDYWSFPTYDPTEWHSFTHTVTLPPGSAPGTWGLSEMTIYDRAQNSNNYSFTELIHFDVDN